LLLPLTQLTSVKHNSTLRSYAVHLCVILRVVCGFGKCKLEKEEGPMPLISKPRFNFANGMGGAMNEEDLETKVIRQQV
jgi:hypothetical protein